MTATSRAPTTRRRSMPRLLTLIVIGLALPTAALAQATGSLSNVPPDQTGTGGGADTTVTAPYTNSLGVTKPPGTALGPDEALPPRLEQRERALTDRIESGICTGCK